MLKTCILLAQQKLACRNLPIIRLSKLYYKYRCLDIFLRRHHPIYHNPFLTLMWQFLRWLIIWRFVNHGFSRLNSWFLDKNPKWKPITQVEKLQYIAKICLNEYLWICTFDVHDLSDMISNKRKQGSPRFSGKVSFRGSSLLTEVRVNWVILKKAQIK